MKIKILISDEQNKLLDTGGGILNATKSFKKPFIALNPDTLWSNAYCNELKNLDKFYFICFNHPEMHVGKNKKIQDNNKCDVQIENFNSVFKKDIKDFRLVLFENKNIK